MPKQNIIEQIRKMQKSFYPKRDMSNNLICVSNLEMKLLKLHDNNGGPNDNGDDEGAGAKEYADDDNADDNDDTLRTVVIS